MITKFHAGHAQSVVRTFLGFEPYTHNDGGTLVIGCGPGNRGAERAEAVQLLCKVPLTKVLTSCSTRLGSVAQQEEWAKTGDAVETFVLIQRY